MNKKLYVSLDSLLDIRLGVLNLGNVDFALEVTKSEDYFLRTEDIFSTKNGGTLKKEIYDSILKEMRTEVLRSSFRTKMYKFINSLRTTFNTASIQSGVPALKEIDVNIYPFSITEEEAKIISVGISRALGGLLKVNLVNVSPELLKLSEARQNYSSMIMYNYHDWLNMNDAEIKKKPLRETNIYVPRLFFSINNREELDEELKKGHDPFDLTQRILSPIINIEYIPVAWYCADIPENKEEYVFKTA